MRGIILKSRKMGSTYIPQQFSVKVRLNCASFFLLTTFTAADSPKRLRTTRSVRLGIGLTTN
jgi:hypothetical protein